jgi:trk system potassium uptake protein TrkA
MNMIVIGCGRVGADLAYRLYKSGHKVCVVDLNEKTFASLPNNFRGRTLEGDALNQTILHRAGIESANGMAVVTDSDPVNAVVAHVAQTLYHVPNVIARNYEPRYRTLYEAFNIQLISPSSWGAQRIEELLIGHKVRSVFSAGNGEVEIYEFKIPNTWNGHQLGELLPERGSRVTALSRAGRATLPGPEIILNEGDVLLISATLEGAELIRKKIEKQGQE